MQRELTGLAGTDPNALAHDLNNVFGVVMNCASLAARALGRLDSDSAEVEDVAADLVRIQDAARQGARLLNEFAAAHRSAASGDLTSPDQADMPISERAEAEAGWPSGLDVLVVDDDERTRASLSRLLRAHGSRVRCAADGAEALDLLAAGSYRVLLTDFRMPGLSGTALARRALAAQPELRVIVMSGGQVGAAPEPHGVVGVRVLEKPFDDDDLLAAIGAAVETKGPGKRVTMGGDRGER